MEDLIYEYLTDKDKNEILGSHIRSHEYSMYNLEVSRTEAESLPIIDQAVIDSLNLKIAEIQSKIAALKAKQALLVIE